MVALSPIIVVAHWHAGAAAMDQVIALVADLKRQSLAEPGCLGYEVFRGLDGGPLLLIERYADEAAVEAHRASTHYRELVQGRIIPLLEHRTVELLQQRGAS